MKISCPIELTAGHHPKWAKEGEDQWVRRLLQIPEGEQAFLHAIRDEDVLIESDGELEAYRLASHELEVLREWILGKFEKQGLFGSAAVICNPDGTRVLLQIKDDKHPTEACRGRYSLFSGSRGIREDPKTTILRELYEEIRDVNVLREMVECMDVLDDQRLPSVRWPGQYVCRLCVIRAWDEKQFERWRAVLFAPDGLAESDPAELRDRELFDALRQEDAEAGSRFVASHNRLIEIGLGLVHEG